MKIFPLLSFLLFLPLTAKEYSVTLPPAPGPEQVFFLDLAKTGADSATFRLTDDRGHVLPFSFDMRIFRPQAPEKYRRPPDGFYSKEAAPAAENRFLYPGWLSFRAVPGAKFYTLTFRDGAAETVARPDPAVRAWWIELMKDPFFRDPHNLSNPRNVKVLPGGGIEFSRSLLVSRKAAVADERSRGRRILGLLRSEGDITYFSFLQRNEVIPHIPALSCYFRNIPGKVTDICAEGIISSRPGELCTNKSFISGFHYVKGTVRIHRLSVQLPPSEKSAGVSLKSDLLNTGDRVRFDVFGLGFPNTIPFSSGGISGLRAGLWKTAPEVVYALFDVKNRAVLKGRGESFLLKNVPPGRYLLRTTLLVAGSEVAKQTFPLTVQKGAF